MSAEKNYQQILEDVCEKLNSIDSVKEGDVLDIKKSIKSIEKLITGSEAQVNFQEIKEKLENIAFQVDATNDTILKDLYNDINGLKSSADSVTQHLDNIQNVQNMALTRAEFDEYQKHQLDMALKSNENIFSELKAIKEKTGLVSTTNDSESVTELTEKLETIHSSLKRYINEVVQNAKTGPSLDEMTEVFTDLNSVTSKNIKQTNVIIKEVQAELLKFHSDFQNRDLMSQIEKIGEIYDSLDVIISWIEKVGYINQSIENVYARLGENIDFDDVAEKVDIIFDNISALNEWAMKIDNIDNSMPEFKNKLGLISSVMEDTGNIINTLNSLKGRFDNTFSEKLDFDDLSEKMDIVYENLAALNKWANKLDIVDGKIDEGAENLNSLKENVNGVSENLGSLSDKVNIISDNIDTVSGNVRGISDDINVLTDKVNSVSDKSDELEKISGKVDDVLNSLVSANEESNAISGEIEKISGKVDDVLNSLVASGEETGSVSDKLEKISGKVEDVLDSLVASGEETGSVSDKLEKISGKAEDIIYSVSGISDLITSKIDIIYENIGLLSTWADKIDDLAQQGKELDEKYTLTNDSLNLKIDEINSTLSKASGIIDGVPDLKDKLEELSNELHTITSTTKNDTESYIYTLLDIESDFLKLHKFLDDTTQITSNDINALKERFVELNDDITSISIRTNKLILSADEANKDFRTCLTSFKESINILNAKTEEFNPEYKYGLLDSKVAEIVLLLRSTTTAAENLNKAFTYLADWIDATGSILNDIQKNVADIEELKDSDTVLGENIEAQLKENAQVITDEIKANTENINQAVLRIEASLQKVKDADITAMKDALTYLVNKSEEFDIKSSLQKIESAVDNGSDIALMKDTLSTTLTKIGALEAAFADFKNDEIADMKSSLTGILVQLNTALMPHIDSLNERIDKLTEQNSGNLTELEALMQEKINEQSKKIEALEEKIEVMGSKFDKLFETVSENNNSELKDILNFIATQLAAVNESVSLQQNNQQNNSEVLTAVAEKVSGFDENIGKIVSYLEED